MTDTERTALTQAFEVRRRERVELLLDATLRDDVQTARQLAWSIRHNAETRTLVEARFWSEPGSAIESLLEFLRERKQIEDGLQAPRVTAWERLLQDGDVG